MAHGHKHEQSLEQSSKQMILTIYRENRLIAVSLSSCATHDKVFLSGFHVKKKSIHTIHWCSNAIQIKQYLHIAVWQNKQIFTAIQMAVRAHCASKATKCYNNIGFGNIAQ